MTQKFHSWVYISKRKYFLLVLLEILRWGEYYDFELCYKLDSLVRTKCNWSEKYNNHIENPTVWLLSHNPSLFNKYMKTRYIIYFKIIQLRIDEVKQYWLEDQSFFRKAVAHSFQQALIDSLLFFISQARNKAFKDELVTITFS